MFRNNTKMKQIFPILPAIFGQKRLKLGCYTMDNFVIQKTIVKPMTILH